MYTRASACSSCSSRIGSHLLHPQQQRQHYLLLAKSSTPLEWDRKSFYSASFGSRSSDDKPLLLRYPCCSCGYGETAPARWYFYRHHHHHNFSFTILKRWLGSRRNGNQSAPGSGGVFLHLLSFFPIVLAVVTASKIEGGSGNDEKKVEEKTPLEESSSSSNKVAGGEKRTELGGNDQDTDEKCSLLEPADASADKSGKKDDSSKSGEKVGDESGGSSGEGPKRIKKKRVGFRERRIIEYENRLRAYSTPDKIFRYFATLKVPNEEDGSFAIFMTPQDFVRSLTPGVMQPRRWGLDKFKIYNPHAPADASKKRGQRTTKSALAAATRDTIFHWCASEGVGGLISFGDYLFLMSLLSTSPNELRLAFHVFDINGDGTLDRGEFEKVQELVLSQSNVGRRHRDHYTGLGSFKSKGDSALIRHFFGGNPTTTTANVGSADGGDGNGNGGGNSVVEGSGGGGGKLGLDELLLFQHDLHRDILRLEFERRDPLSAPAVGVISEVSFAELLLLHSNLPPKRQRRMLARVRRKYSPKHLASSKKGGGEVTSGEQQPSLPTADSATAATRNHTGNEPATHQQHQQPIPTATSSLPQSPPPPPTPPTTTLRGVSIDETYAFFSLLYHIDRVDIALHFHKLAGRPLDKALIQRLARKLINVEVSDTVVDVVIALFDENGDGQLSQREFIAVMRRRMQRGLDRPKDTGAWRFVDALWECAKRQLVGGGPHTLPSTATNTATTKATRSH